MARSQTAMRALRSVAADLHTPDIMPLVISKPSSEAR